jgi:putative oxidoreductase
MKYVILFGRTVFAFIFIFSVPVHFSQETIKFVALSGVPLASIAVPVSGIIALIGGLSVLLGYKAKLGAWLLVLFLVPVTLMMHNFWSVQDSMMARIQMAMFFKNISIMGGAFFITYFGSGPLSLDEWVNNYIATKEKNEGDIDRNSIAVDK